VAVDDDQGQAEPLSILSDWPAGGRSNGAIVEATIIWTAPLAFAKRRPLPSRTARQSRWAHSSVGRAADS
jgi:hypothetical protein